MYRGNKVIIRKEREKYIVYLKKSNQFFVANGISSEIIKMIDMNKSTDEIICSISENYETSQEYARACITNIASEIRRDSVGDFSGIVFSAPIRVGWRVTPRCNLRCLHCYLDYANKSDYTELSTEQCKLIIDKLAASGIMEVLVTGGELFTRRDIEEILRYITSKKINLTLFTNATLITEKMEWLKEIQLRKINISLDGDETAHDRLRGKGSFAKTLNSIKLLKKWGISIAINCVISTFNVDKIDIIEAFFDENGIEHQYTMITPVGSAKDNGYLVPTDEQYREATKKIYEMMKDGRKNTSYYDTNKEKFLVSHKGHEKQLNVGWMCNAGHTKVDIDFNGDVYLCPFDESTKIGNILTDDLVKMWSHRLEYDFMKNKKNNVLHICEPIGNYMEEFQNV